MRQNEVQIKPGEMVSVSLPILNLMGFVNTEEFQVMQATYVELHPNLKDFMAYDRSHQYSDISETLG